MSDIHIPIETSKVDSTYDRIVGRLRLLVAIAIGAFLGGLGTPLWADSRYVRLKDLDELTKSFTAHSTAQQQLEAHVAEDRASYATREELARHTAQAGHTSSLDKNRSQDRRIRQLEQAQVWTARALWAIARKQGIQLPPPPVLTPEEPEQP